MSVAGPQDSTDLQLVPQSIAIRIRSIYVSILGRIYPPRTICLGGSEVKGSEIVVLVLEGKSTIFGTFALVVLRRQGKGVESMLDDDGGDGGSKEDKESDEYDEEGGEGEVGVFTSAGGGRRVEFVDDVHKATEDVGRAKKISSLSAM
ncbi:hypothetical protein NE237_008007 [Protea cynaroides]|uniref:Uncharacterized protein n=1 Tax=Protea cynaroides TaxID=273540 RepID=A0A9Q0QWQ3_9MAGN|nr:hypothetical protein NE237_008007 [Protea cynaroides]